MQKQAINPDTLATPVGHFDRAIRMDNMLWISGTSALTHVKGDVQDRKLPASIEEQTRLTFENIKKVLDEAGGSLSDIFKLQVYIVRREDWDAIDAVTKDYLPDKGFINSAFVTELLNPDMLIEIEATAWLE